RTRLEQPTLRGGLELGELLRGVQGGRTKSGSTAPIPARAPSDVMILLGGSSMHKGTCGLASERGRWIGGSSVGGVRKDDWRGWHVHRQLHPDGYARRVRKVFDGSFGGRYTAGNIIARYHVFATLQCTAGAKMAHRVLGQGEILRRAPATEP